MNVQNKLYIDTKEQHIYFCSIDHVVVVEFGAKIFNIIHRVQRSC